MPPGVPHPTVHHGDCLNVMRAMPANSVNAIVTDPPYGLGFMGKDWDDLPPGLPWARECLRVLKPGGHLLAFGGTRTWHRLAVAVEDAGFEVRDSIAWLYGSGFPKSLDVSKAIDKRKDWTLVSKLADAIREARAASGLSLRQVGEAVKEVSGGSHGEWYHRGGHMFFETGMSLPGRAEWGHLRAVLPIPAEFDAMYEEADREVIRSRTMTQGGGTSLQMRMGEIREVNADITAPATPAAQQWQGWGTALKPAFEPIVVARKPLVGTVAANVLAHGTGALNIDGCRVEGAPELRGRDAPGNLPNGNGSTHGAMTRTPYAVPSGRWPANVLLDGDAAAGVGEESRFFPVFRYQAKAPTRERVKVGDVAHPTVKPLELMRWLVRLATPPGGVVLDPFAGSGTTVEAAILEGFEVIGIEREADYLPLIEARIARNRSTDEPQPVADDLLLFGDDAA